MSGKGPVVRIRAVSVESLGLDDGKPPNYGSISANVNGVDVRLGLDQRQIGKLIAAAFPIADELLAKIAPKR